MTTLTTILCHYDVSNVCAEDISLLFLKANEFPLKRADVSDSQVSFPLGLISVTI